MRAIMQIKYLNHQFVLEGFFPNHILALFSLSTAILTLLFILSISFLSAKAAQNCAATFYVHEEYRQSARERSPER